MSIAGDVLKAAVERQQKVREDQADAVGQVAEQFCETLKAPWRARVEAIGQAVKAVREILDPPEG